jgi:hypothetical protein
MRNRFAHSTAPQDADGFAGHDVEADAIKHDVFAERFGNLAELDVRVLHGFGHRLALEN